MRCTNPKCPSWTTHDPTVVPELPRKPKLNVLYIRTCTVCGETCNHAIQKMPVFGFLYHSIESVRIAKEA